MRLLSGYGEDEVFDEIYSCESERLRGEEAGTEAQRLRLRPEPVRRTTRDVIESALR